MNNDYYFISANADMKKAISKPMAGTARNQDDKSSRSTIIAKMIVTTMNETPIAFVLKDIALAPLAIKGIGIIGGASTKCK